jgi:hypothetical protein
MSLQRRNWCRGRAGTESSVALTIGIWLSLKDKLLFYPAAAEQQGSLYKDHQLFLQW